MTDKIIEDFKFPAEVVRAIHALHKNLQPFVKDERNPHANFAYVSIDKFYATIPAKMREAGLWWTVREVEASMQYVMQGDKQPTCKFVYEFDLLFRPEIRSDRGVPDPNQNMGGVVPAIDKITIFIQRQGAQTSGAARSYAEKLFMRHLLKIVTGEKDDQHMQTEQHMPDADASNPNWGMPAPMVGTDPMAVPEYPAGGQPPAVWQPPEGERAPFPPEPNAAFGVDRPAIMDGEPEPGMPGSIDAPIMGAPNDGAVSIAPPFDTPPPGPDGIPAPAEPEGPYPPGHPANALISHPTVLDGLPMIKRLDEYTMEDHKVVAEIFHEHVDTATDKMALQNFWTRNNHVLEPMQKNAPSLFEGVKAAFGTRKGEIEAGITGETS